MRNTLIIFVALTVTACNKSYNCECTSRPAPNSTNNTVSTTAISVQARKESDAKDKCEENDKVYPDGSSTYCVLI